MMIASRSAAQSTNHGSNAKIRSWGPVLAAIQSIARGRGLSTESFGRAPPYSGETRPGERDDRGCRCHGTPPRQRATSGRERQGACDPNTEQRDQHREVPHLEVPEDADEDLAESTWSRRSVPK